jgi:membrane associated rhomboid family serine protease
MIPIRDDNPVYRKPVVTYGLIGLCVIVYLAQLVLGQTGFHRAFYSFGLIPAVLTGHAVLPPDLDIVPPVVTVVTSMFLHGGFFHLAGNMLYLWIFADNVEDSLGRWRFAVFYFLCGLGAAMAQVLPSPGSQVPMVGASGAISGVLGAYLLMHPHARVVVVIPVFFVLQIVRLRAVTVLGFWFLLQLLSSLMTSSGEGGVAFRAHVGGFLTGLVLLPLFRLGRRQRW